MRSIGGKIWSDILETLTVCALCYDKNNIILNSHFLKIKNTEGKMFLSMCRDCLDAGVTPVLTTGCIYYQKKKQQDNAGEDAHCKKSAGSRWKEKCCKDSS